jgi:hypothetical protein
MANEMNSVDPSANAIASILEANGIGERASLNIKNIEERASDSEGNRLLMAEVGNHCYFVVLSPALKGRLVGDDGGIYDENVRDHFGVNLMGEPFMPKSF